MKKILLALIAAFASAAGAQENPWRPQAPVASPDVHADGSVTFRYVSPSAKSVRVAGNFLKLSEMNRRADGVWELTTPPLSPELYSYVFIVDSVPVLDPLNGSYSRDIDRLTSSLFIPGNEVEAYDMLDIPHGDVARVWYDSPTLGGRRRMSVYTPAGYTDSTERRYPVLYLLHGMGGDENAWLENGRAAQILDYLIARRKAEPMIVVMPNGNPSMRVAPPDGAFAASHPADSLYRVVNGTFEASVPGLVEYVDSHYRTLPQKESRAIAGLSMGGFHAMMISKEYPDMFDYVGLFSAATEKELGTDSSVSMYTGFDAKLHEQFKQAPELYWIGIGSDDFLYDSNRIYRGKLDREGYRYEYHESTGGHEWRNWRKYLLDFAPKLFR